MINAQEEYSVLIEGLSTIDIPLIVEMYWSVHAIQLYYQYI